MTLAAVLPMVVTVRPGSQKMFSTGTGLAAGGLALLLVSTIAFGIDGAVAGEYGSSAFLERMAYTTGLETLGTGTICGVVGLSVLITGIVLWANAKGRADVAPSPRLTFDPTFAGFRF